VKRVALVTGAARGIGAATVDALVERCYDVVAVDSCAGQDGPPGVAYHLATPDDLAALGERHGERVHTVTADVREPAQMDATVLRALEHFGRLDVAVAAAGVMVGGHAQWETPADHVSTLFDVNAFGVWNTASAVIPAMLNGPAPSGCRFVAVASAAGERGLFHLSAYTASKHAVIGIIRGLAADLVGTGITAVAVSPGSTRTAMLAATSALYSTEPEDLARHQGLQRLIEPEEIAETIALCCSSAGAVLNGSVVHADGNFLG
jgi:SDR family mycofactocin-dependent oxidoreductase